MRTTTFEMAMATQKVFYSVGSQTPTMSGSMRSWINEDEATQTPTQDADMVANGFDFRNIVIPEKLDLGFQKPTQAGTMIANGQDYRTIIVDYGNFPDMGFQSPTQSGSMVSNGRIYIKIIVPEQIDQATQSPTQAGTMIEII